MRIAWWALPAAFLLAIHCGGDAIVIERPPACAPPLLACDGRCTDIAKDPASCGACGTPCTAGDTCNDGVCARTGCPAGRTDCGGLCVDLATNPLNCGACNRACSGAEVCVDGMCSCPPPAVVCDGVCTDIASSLQHCGACGRACASDEVCKSGSCGPRCAAPLSFCADRCVDFASDTTACGGCQNPCAPEEACVLGTCQCPNDPGHAICDGVCVDLSARADNCGGCGNVCSAGMHCENGLCTTCRSSFFFCPSEQGDPLETCLAQARDASQSDAGGSSALECQCNNCLVELDDCVRDADCVAAWQCALRNACQAPCWGPMDVCNLSGGWAGSGGCLKWCEPTAGSPQTAARAEALMTCTRSHGCGT